MNKIKVTEEQEKAILNFKESDNDLAGFAEYKELFSSEYESIKDFTVDEMAIILYGVGYEVIKEDPEFKTGDWVVSSQGRIGIITQFNLFDVNHAYLDAKIDDSTSYVNTLIDKLRFATDDEIKIELRKRDSAGMGLNNYQKLSKRTYPEDKTYNEKMNNFGLGISGESGEIADIVKKHLGHGHALDKNHLAEELGDVMFYIASMATFIGYELSTIAKMNVDKLESRYPNGFNEEDSINRKN